MSCFFSVVLLALLALPLPRYFTVSSPLDSRTMFLTRNPFAVSGEAVAADIGDGRAKRGIALWRGDALSVLPHVPKSSRFPNSTGFYITLGTIAPSGTLFAMRATPFDGAYIGTDYDVLRLSANDWTQVSVDGCKVGFNVGHVERVESDGTLDITYESPELINFDVAATGQYAPYAARLNGSTCRVLGRFNLRDVNGHFAVGYRGYLNGTLAPTNLNVVQQEYFAVRYHAGKLTQMGRGEAFAVASDGTAVGADAPPFHGTVMFGSNTGMSRTYRTYSCCTPHAVLWDMHGRTIALAPQSPQSIAFAIDAKHRVLGALLGRDGRHYAFLWDRGRLHLLDDVAHAPGWRFEGAYRFMPDGSIVGAGTHDGIATAFLMPVQDYSKPSAIP